MDWSKNYSIRDLAKECGVSVSTASKALNNYPGVSEETRRKVQEAASRQKYTPNAAAKLLKQSENKTVVLLINDAMHPYFNLITKEYSETMTEEGYDIAIRFINGEDPVYAALKAVRETRACALVILGGSVLGREEEFDRLDIPVVLFGKYQDLSAYRNISSFYIDELLECYRLTRFLQERGARRIAFLTTEKEGLTVGGLRTAGYLRAMREIGAEDPELTVVVEDSYYRSGYVGMAGLLRRHLRVDSVLCVSDRLCMGCCRALYDWGLQVPKDVLVAGFDGSEFTDYHVPTLTTVAMPSRDLYRDSARHLLDRLQNQEETRCRGYSCAIIEKESTQPGKRMHALYNTADRPNHQKESHT